MCLGTGKTNWGTPWNGTLWWVAFATVWKRLTSPPSSPFLRLASAYHEKHRLNLHCQYLARAHWSVWWYCNLPCTIGGWWSSCFYIPKHTQGLDRGWTGRGPRFSMVVLLDEAPWQKRTTWIYLSPIKLIVPIGGPSAPSSFALGSHCRWDASLKRCFWTHNLFYILFTSEG